MMFQRFSIILLILFYQECSATPVRPVLMVTYDYPPYMMASTANTPTSGLVVATVHEAFRRMQTPVEIKFFPLARGLAMLDAGQADGIFTIKITSDRKGKYIYSSAPILIQDYVFFVRENFITEFHGNFQELRNVSIGVHDKASYGPIFDEARRKGEFHRIEISHSHEENFRKLLAGRMEMVLCSRLVGLSLLKRLNASGLVRVSGRPVESVPSYVAWHASTPPLLIKNFDTAISKMKKDGFMRKLYSESP